MPRSRARSATRLLVLHLAGQIHESIRHNGLWFGFSRETNRWVVVEVTTGFRFHDCLVGLLLSWEGLLFTHYCKLLFVSRIYVTIEVSLLFRLRWFSGNSQFRWARLPNTLMPNVCVG